VTLAVRPPHGQDRIDIERHTTKILTIAALLAALVSPVLAQPKPDGRPALQPAAAADMIDGDVRKVDKDARKITIKHGEIKHLDMPPMTMVFQVKDPALLDKVKAGDKVRFVAQKTDAGYVVTGLQVAK
jgi:Cu(I)/Ag(I) efflux system protein CusF